MPRRTPPTVSAARLPQAPVLRPTLWVTSPDLAADEALLHAWWHDMVAEDGMIPLSEPEVAEVTDAALMIRGAREWRVVGRAYHPDDVTIPGP